MAFERYPLELERNDTAAAVRWVETHFARFGGPPAEDAMAILYQLQDDPDELEPLIAEVLKRHEALPEEIAIEPGGDRG